MDLELNGKIALVTAATEGLGLACAVRLARAGCSVAICGRREQALAAAGAKLSAVNSSGVLTMRADIADRQSVEQLVGKVRERFGRIDILVVNSGHVAYGSVEDLSEDQWNEAYQLLLMSAVRLTRLVIPIMRANAGGDIVFLSSATVREPPPHLLLSTVMRLGVLGLSKTLARALAPENIRVNLVAPGYFHTGRVRERIDTLMKIEGLSREAATARIAGNIPAGRIGTAEEFAELVAFVASRKAGFMIGNTIAIDGAATHGLF
jgi:3-oxoacyl-[acyl-carrier protein] reductase